MSFRTKDPVSGFTHLVGLVLAALGVAWLVVSRTNDFGMNAGVSIYGASLIALYAASSAYHLLSAGERVTRALRALDHLAIFLLVAGTCTPVFYRAFVGTTRVAMLAAVWGAALVGVLVRALWRRAPRALYTALYVAMGWMIVLRWSEVSTAIPTAALVLVIAGGVTYCCRAFSLMASRAAWMMAVRQAARHRAAPGGLSEGHASERRPGDSDVELK